MALFFVLFSVLNVVSALQSRDRLSTAHHSCVGCPVEEGCLHIPGKPREHHLCHGTTDGSDCRLYHICDNGISHSFTCPSGERFNGTVCEKHSSCETFRCKRTLDGHNVSHPVDPTVFAFCLNGEVQCVDRCPPYYMMYPGVNQCLPECQYAGDVLAHPTRDWAYYLCSRSSPFKVTEWWCQHGKQFYVNGFKYKW